MKKKEIKITPKIMKATRNLIKSARKFKELTGHESGIKAKVGEVLICKKNNWLLAPEGQKGFDAINKNGKRLQIKVTKNKGEGSGRISKLGNHPFDYLILGILDKNYNLKKTFIREANDVKELGKNSSKGPPIRAIIKFPAPSSSP